MPFASFLTVSNISPSLSARTKLKSSAHYFVDETSIWQSVEDSNRAWHCGGGLQGKGGHTYHGICTNSNSIGVEMCVKKNAGGEWYFEPETVNNTVDLVKHLMKIHNIPLDRVIRHYDVTGKICPAPYIDETEWQAFKAKISENKGDLTVGQYNELKAENKALKAEIQALKNAQEKVYHYTVDVPEYYRPTVQRLLDEGKFNGRSASDLGLTESMARMFVILEKAGLL